MARPIFGLILILIGVLVGFSLLTQNASGNASGATYIAEKSTYISSCRCLYHVRNAPGQKKEIAHGSDI